MAAPNREFADYCCELLAAAGPCTARRMFGGWGIATGGLNIAIIAFEQLFLKVHPGTQARFAAAGGTPFTYEARGKTMQLGYFTAPAEAMESPAQMAPWARLALEAALLAASKKPQARTQRSRPATKSIANRDRPTPSRSTAPTTPRAAKPALARARRKSARG